jgi:hypothetical protein
MVLCFGFGNAVLCLVSCLLKFRSTTDRYFNCELVKTAEYNITYKFELAASQCAFYLVVTADANCKWLTAFFLYNIAS